MQHTLRKITRSSGYSELAKQKGEIESIAMRVVDIQAAACSDAQPQTEAQCGHPGSTVFGSVPQLQHRSTGLIEARPVDEVR